MEVTWKMETGAQRKNEDRKLRILNKKERSGIRAENRVIGE